MHALKKHPLPDVLNTVMLPLVAVILKLIDSLRIVVWKKY